MTFHCSIAFSSKESIVRGKLPAAVDEGGQSIDVSQKRFGKSGDVLCVTLVEIIVFMDGRIAVNADFFGPLSHRCSDLSIRGERLETFFQLPSLIHSFRRQVQCFTEQKDGGLVLASVEVVESFLVRIAYFFGHVVRDLPLHFFWVLQIHALDDASRVIKIENRIRRPVITGEFVLCYSTHNHDFIAVWAAKGNPKIPSCENDVVRPHAGFTGSAMRAVECRNVFNHAFVLGGAVVSFLIICCFVSKSQDLVAKNV